MYRFRNELSLDRYLLFTVMGVSTLMGPQDMKLSKPRHQHRESHRSVNLYLRAYLDWRSHQAYTSHVTAEISRYTGLAIPVCAIASRAVTVGGNNAALARIFAVVRRMRVESLHRYPVKSMLGETVTALFVDEQGAEGDRRLALIDVSTGRVASAKQPRLWRGLLQCSANKVDGRVRIRLPDGTSMATDEAGVNERLSQLLPRPVRLIDHRPQGAAVERADPDQVLERGLDAEVDSPILEIAQATAGDSFTDLAPLHAITTATLQRIGVEALRYRPNLVITSPPGYPAYAENEWTGRILTVGETRLRGIAATPRCAIPTLEHGALPRAPHALRIPAAENRVEALGLGRLPCAGAYFEVLEVGTIRTGDLVGLD